MFKRFALFFVFCFFSFAFGQSRIDSELSDVVVVLDTSGSLLSYYDDVTGKVLNEIFTNYVKKKDVFHLISFNASVHLEISQTLNSAEDFSNIVSKFLTSYPLAKSSDVLLALDFLKNYLSTLSPLHNKKVIFISDGLFTISNKDVDYTQEDFEKKLSDFSAYFEGMEKIRTYYVKLPITSNHIVMELNNDLSSFISSSLEMTEILAYPLIVNLPLSLKEYLRFDDLGGAVFRGRNTQAFDYSSDLVAFTENASVTDEEKLANIELNLVDDVVRLNVGETVDEKTLTGKLEAEKNLEIVGSFGTGEKLKVEKPLELKESIENLEERLEASKDVSVEKTIGAENTLEAGENFVATEAVEDVEKLENVGNFEAGEELEVENTPEVEKKIEELKENLEDEKKDFGSSQTEKTQQPFLDAEKYSSEINKTAETSSHGKKPKTKKSFSFIIYIILGLLIFSFLILFFLIEKFSKKADGKEEDAREEAVSPHSHDISFSATDDDEVLETENIDSKNEILVSSVEEYLDTSEENPKNLDFKTEKLSFEKLEEPTEISSVSKKIDGNLLKDENPTSKNNIKEEKILLNVKTIENKLKTEYSPTFFTLSPDTKKAFAKGSTIEGMISLLNASYVDANDVFYRFKHSLYTKKYVKNIDATKQNYIEMFVLNQRRSIGSRNTHFLSLDRTFYLGGGKRDDFLIFLVPIPRRLASIHYDEKEIVFNILEPKYFPYEKETEIKNPIDRFFVINSDKNYLVHFMFRLYEKETISKDSKPIIST